MTTVHIVWRKHKTIPGGTAHVGTVKKLPEVATMIESDKVSFAAELAENGLSTIDDYEYSYDTQRSE